MTPSVRRIRVAVILVLSIHAWAQDQIASRVDDFIPVESGKVFVAFYKASPVQEDFLERVGLLRGAQLAFRDSLEIYLLNPAQMVDWVAARAGLGRFRATLALLRVGVHSSRRERRNTLTMQRVMRKFPNPRTLINAAPEKLPYRNEREIRNLFERLGVPGAHLRVLASCCVARIEP